MGLIYLYTKADIPYKVRSYLDVNGSGSFDISDSLACDLVAIPTNSPSDISLESYHYTNPSRSWAAT